MGIYAFFGCYIHHEWVRDTARGWCGTMRKFEIHKKKKEEKYVYFLSTVPDLPLL